MLGRQRPSKRHDDSDQISDRGTPGRLYEIIEKVLRDYIVNSKLPAGLVLLEGPIAQLFETSRAPVQKALRLLNKEGLIQRFEGRGYVIPTNDPDSTPLRMDIRKAGLEIPLEVGLALRPQSSWQRIYGQAQRDLARAAAFGRYHINEARMADFFNVSRTVVRDTLGRLDERGIVHKTARSRWVTGPLTAAATREMYEIRKLLEPAALLSAAPELNHDVLSSMLDQLVALEANQKSLTPELLYQLDRNLHIDQMLSVNSNRLILTIRQNQLPLLTNRIFHEYLGTSDARATLIEHRLIIEHLLRDAPEAAAAALVAHLNTALRRSLARLKVLSVIPAPKLLPYMSKA